MRSQGLTSPGGVSNSESLVKSPNTKQVPDFDKAQKRDTIFSSCSRAKTIIGHYEGRPQVHDKRFESPNILIKDSQMSWTGVRPRKLSMNINFTKPTNRDGSKLIVV